MSYKTWKTDVLVIGGGGAAARAAIEAADEKASVAMVLKGLFPKSGATAYKVSEMAGFNAGDGAADAADSPQEHYNDIMEAAEGMAIGKLARIVAFNAPDTLKKLDSWGVPYERDGDNYLAFKSCFSNKARTHVIKGHGEPIMEAMQKQIARRNIQVIENSMAAELLIQDGVCCGAVLVNEAGEICFAYAKSVIMATGGAGQVFARNLNPQDITGDGYALGYRAGAELINMEFMQSGIGVSYPFDCLLNAYIWSGFPLVTNKDGENFLEKGVPDPLTVKEVMQDHGNHFPFSCSDNSFYIETLVQKELLEGRGTPEGGVYMNLNHMTDEYVAGLEENTGLKKMWHIARDFYKEQGVDVLKDALQITCFAHAINGGLLIDEEARTSIEGLYACGETAGGPHGANRLGGNMLLTCQIYGAIAGKSAAKRAGEIAGYRELSADEVKACAAKVENLLYKKLDCEELKKALQQSAQYRLLVRRTESGLKELCETLDQLERTIESAVRGEAPNRKNLEIANLCMAARLMSVAALERRESRGAHFREDYPQRNDEVYAKPYLLKQGTKGEMQLFPAEQEEL